MSYITRFKTSAVIGGLLLITASVYIWNARLSPSARRVRQSAAAYRAYEEVIDRHDEAMRLDAAGGATPEETIRMLADALEREDAALAASYFVPEDNPASVDYLSHRAIEGKLEALRQQGGLPKIAAMLREMHPAEHKTATAATVDYIAKSPPQQAMTLRYNPETKVWKVESL